MSNAEALMPNGNPRYVRVYDLGDNVPKEREGRRYTVVFTGNYAKPEGCNYWLEMGPTVFKLCKGSGLGIDRTWNEWPIRIGRQHPELGTRIEFLSLPELCQMSAIVEYEKIWGL